MAADTTNSNFLAALKRIYNRKNRGMLTYTERPLLAMLPKDEGAGGESTQIVYHFGNPQGIARVFSTAQTNRTEVKVGALQLARVNLYSVASIQGETIESSRGDNYAFLSALTEVIDGAWAALADTMESLLYGNGSGALAQLHATTAPTAADPMVLTLKYGDEIAHFELEMTIAAQTTDDLSPTARSTPATASVEGVGLLNDVGTITTDYDNDPGATNWAVDDYLVRSGTQAAAGVAGCYRGLKAWIPATAPAPAESFFGLDRSVSFRLYGQYMEATGGSLADNFVKAQSLAVAQQFPVNTCIVNHVQHRRAVQELGAKREYCEPIPARDGKGAIQGMGFKGVFIDGSKGPISVVAANKCPVRSGFMLSLSSWMFHTLGTAPRVIDLDATRILREPDDDAYEIRIVARGNPATRCPVGNVQMLMPVPA